MTGRGWRIQRNADGSGTWVNTDALDALYEEHSKAMQARRREQAAVKAAIEEGIRQERERYRSMPILEKLAYSVGVLVEDWKRSRLGNL